MKIKFFDFKDPAGKWRRELPVWVLLTGWVLFVSLFVDCVVYTGGPGLAAAFAWLLVLFYYGIPLIICTAVFLLVRIISFVCRLIKKRSGKSKTEEMVSADPGNF